MSRRISAFMRRNREPARDPDPTPPANEFQSASNSSTAQYASNQTPYGNNTVAFQSAVPNPEPPYRAVPPVPSLGRRDQQSNLRDPRTNVINTLPYPQTPRPLQTIPQQNPANNNNNNNNAAYMRDRTSSNPSTHSYGSSTNPSEFSLISSPQNPSPREQNISPTEVGAYRLSPGAAPVSGRPNELPVPGGVPYMPPHNPQNGFHDRRSSNENHFQQQQHQHQHPSRAPPPAPPAAARQHRANIVPAPPAPTQQPQQAPSQPQRQQQQQQQQPPYPYPHEEVPSPPPAGGPNISQERVSLQRRNNTSKTYIRELRHLIREKYRLDVWIWSNRDVLDADRDIVKARCVKADVAMQEIRQIIFHWEEGEFEPEEWRVARRIKENILKHAEEQKSWTEVPPWDRPEEMSQEAPVGDVTAAVNRMEL